MRRVFRILSSKLDRKLNHPQRARTILRSKMNIYGTIIRRVYGEYTITSFLGNFGECANIRYQAAFPPPPSLPGYEANHNCDKIVATFYNIIAVMRYKWACVRTGGCGQKFARKQARTFNSAPPPPPQFQS